MTLCGCWKTTRDSFHGVDLKHVCKSTHDDEYHVCECGYGWVHQHGGFDYSTGLNHDGSGR